jgi:type IV pilus assembly protein PilA
MIARIRKALEEREEGFTLIELLVVIIIIGILAAIAIPIFLNQRQKGYDAAIKNDLHNAALAEEAFMTDNQYYYAPTNPLVAGDAALTPDGLKFSPPADYAGGKVQMNVTVFDGSGTAVAAAATSGTGGYCIWAQSASQKYWEYNSGAGGLDPSPFSTQPTCGSATAWS